LIAGHAFDAPTNTRPDVRAIVAIAVLAYFVLVGGLLWRDIPIAPIARVISSALAAWVVLLYVVRAPARADRFDRNILIGVLLVTVAGGFSEFPRQSFDADLGALLYGAALFVAREVLSRESARRLLVVGLMVLSGLLTIVIAGQLIVPFLQWWALTDWKVFPPLDLKIQPEPWIFRYELILLLVMLYPSWWIGRITRLRAAAAVLIGILIVATCLIVGSRTIWLASGAGVAALVLPRVQRGFASDIRGWARTTTAVAVVVTALLVSGLGAAIVERVFRIAPLAERGSTWGPLLALWADRPFVGHGPGSFPWLLQLTTYFDTNSLSPRTPDNTLIQLLAETGLIGLTAALLVLGTVLLAVFRGSSQSARFALIACLVAGVGLNPAEFAPITAIAITWVAFGVPRQPVVPVRAPTARTSGFQAVSVVAVLLIGLAFAATSVADYAYSSARAAIAAGDHRQAESSLELATVLDPGLAIYPRQLGTLRLIDAQYGAATIALERATVLNPSDDLAWRILGLARAETGDWTGSRMAMDRAVDVQRSDPTNLLLLAEILRRQGNQPAAAAVLAEVVQGWPLIVAAPGWAAWADAISTGELVNAAHDRWIRGLPSPEMLVSQPILLGVMIGLGDTVLEREQARLTPTLRRAYVAVMRCDQDAAGVLHRSSTADQRTATYWALSIRLAHVSNASSGEYQRLYLIMTGDTVLSDRTFPPLNPLDENGARGSSADTWGYRRFPIEWPDSRWHLPSPRSGFAHWHRDPGGAVREAELERILGGCR
jgi:O-antigen ligase